MATETLIRVFEHQKLRITQNPKETGLTTDQWDSLVRFVEKSPFPYYRPIHRGIQFNHYVGVIRVGKLTIEILPKVGQCSDADLWQRVLIDMLRESRLLDIRSISQAARSVRHRSILEMYLDLFVSEVEQLVHEGLAKSYRQTNANRTALVGKLLFPQQISHNLVHQERFFVRHQIYDVQIVPNRLLYKTLQLIHALSNNPRLLSRVRTLFLIFPQQQEINVSEESFTQIVYNRKTERYRPSLEIARMLLLNYHPDLIQGTNQVLALLFDMNQVWERFLGQRLSKAIIGEPYTVHNQLSKQFWGSKTIRPDLFLEHSDKQQGSNDWPNLIIDAKWKVNPTLSPADDDLKQMYVYNHHFQSSKSVLVYPSVEKSSTTLTRPYHLPSLVGFHSCQLCSLQVLDGQGLNKNLAFDLLRFIS